MADRASSKDEESTVARWSRRKHETRDVIETSDTPKTQEAPASPDQEREKTDQADAVAALPPIDGLTAESDFTPFLDRAVPAELRRLALRKLWLSDPSFGHLDGLNDYDDDFRTLGVGKLVRTAYQVGRGMMTRAEQASDNAEHASPIGDTSDLTRAVDDPDQEPQSANPSTEQGGTDPTSEA